MRWPRCHMTPLTSVPAAGTAGRERACEVAAFAPTLHPMGELRVVFSPGEGAGGAPYRARLTDASGARLGTEVPFAPFLEDSDYEDLRWYLEEYMELPDGGAVTRAQRIEKRLDDWGRRLYDALFADAANAASPFDDLLNELDDNEPLVADSPDWMLAAVVQLSEQNDMNHERDMENR